MYKLVHTDEKLNYKWLQSHGGFNDWPHPIKECTVEDFLRTICVYSPEYIEYRQIYENQQFRQMIIYWFHLCGFALEIKYALWEGEYYHKVINYYYIGCEHQWQSRTIGTCLHEETCRSCGFKRVIDSSG